MKYTFSLKAAKNGGVVLIVRGNYSDNQEPNGLVKAAIAMANEMKRDPMLPPLEKQDPETYDPDLSGEYFFNWFDNNGEKKNPLSQALEFITYIVEEYGLSQSMDYAIHA